MLMHGKVSQKLAMGCFDCGGCLHSGCGSRVRCGSMQTLAQRPPARPLFCCCCCCCFCKLTLGLFPLPCGFGLQAPKVVMGPGTGLGAAQLMWDEGRQDYKVWPGEREGRQMVHCG